MAKNPNFKSRLYGNVLFKMGRYKGWKNIYVGLGRMEFAKGNEVIKVQEDEYNSKDWMKQCWDKFIEKAK